MDFIPPLSTLYLSRNFARLSTTVYYIRNIDCKPMLKEIKDEMDILRNSQNSCHRAKTKLSRNFASLFTTNSIHDIDDYIDVGVFILGKE